MATGSTDSFFYVADFANHVFGFSKAGTGALSPLGGSPFDTGTVGALGSMAVYPEKSCTVSIALDIKPQTCPNTLNVNALGVLPVALVGTADFDVARVDPDSIALEGVASLKSALADVATPYTPFTGKINTTDCTTAGPDGRMDLSVKFDLEQLAAVLGATVDGEVRVLKLTGNLLPAFGGTVIRGEDVAVIINKKE
jgi:hypothetical protein